MGVLSRFRRRRASKQPYAALSEEERLSRYVYLLNTLPASVIEKAHASAFADVPVERRREMFEELRPFMSSVEQKAASDDPTVIARMLRRAQDHRARQEVGGAAADATATATAVRDPRDRVDPEELLRRTGVMHLVAFNVITSQVVAGYFIVGAGSLAVADEPGWVGETYNPDSYNLETGEINPGGGGFEGMSHGGGDGGWFSGFGGGFDGGFDGGGGFG